MKRLQIQLIRDLISIQTNVKKINCFSFWDKNENKNFFTQNDASLLNFKYIVGKTEKIPNQTTYRFSNYIYHDYRWYFQRKIGPFDFSFVINEKDRSVTANRLCHNLFIKVSWVEPVGYILTDYINYTIEKMGMSYHDGAAGRINNKTFLLFGFGKNFKTTIMNMILHNGGYYIGEEFFLLNKDKVYATIPNSHRFDFRESHKKLMQIDLRKRKVDVSEYNVGIFLVYSNKDKIVELDINQANAYAKVFHQYIANSFFYSFLKAKDFLESNSIVPENILLTNKKAKFFIIYFSRVENAFKFIKEY